MKDKNNKIWFTEYRDASVAYNLDSASISLDEVFFPSVTVCNMNTLRRSFIHSIIQDEKLKLLNVSFYELKKIVQLLFIEGKDYQLSDREREIVESNFFMVIGQLSKYKLGAFMVRFMLKMYVLE